MKLAARPSTVKNCRQMNQKLIYIHETRNTNTKQETLNTGNATVTLKCSTIALTISWVAASCRRAWVGPLRYCWQYSRDLWRTFSSVLKPSGAQPSTTISRLLKRSFSHQGGTTSNHAHSCKKEGSLVESIKSN